MAVRLTRFSDCIRLHLMKIHSSAAGLVRLEDLPNIGKSIASDLRGIGIPTPLELSRHSPLETFGKLATQMGKRHDPCVLHTLLSVQHFQKTGESLPWWKFTEDGKRLLRDSR